MTVCYSLIDLEHDLSETIQQMLRSSPIILLAHWNVVRLTRRAGQALIAYLGNFGMTNLRGSPVNDFRKATRSAFSSAVRPNGLTSGLRLGLLPPP